ncbi:Tetraspanin-5 [Hondaea fermentalgiana]|uniref:Tetraspanin-5 n=1 Tax=Hondaea fermentalgiana TaxID=2315210 RepID=A0A2R5G5Y1_9STRA|nr:Tetraspanin-5 [Hondaea fermentalgiana]|eukprot:GBG26446.1 Tetraspanin-5 [Hondaea fermentalgiana]
MGCCSEASRKYLLAINTFLCVLGLAILGLGVYAVVEYKDVLDNINSVAPYGGVIVGALIFIVGILGCFGVRNQNKPALVVFWVVMTFATIVVLALGSALILYLGLLDDIDNNNATIDEAAQKVNDFEMAVYDQCCVPDYTTDEAPLCADVNRTYACVYDETSFEDIHVGDSFCNALEQTTIDDVTVVSSAGGCSSPVVFHELFSTFLNDNLLPVGITLIVLAVILLIALIATCVIICTNRYDYDKEYRARVQQQEAGVVTGTQPTTYN